MHFKDSGADSSEDRGQVAANEALDLMHENKPLRACIIHRECGTKAGFKQ
jgi:hypothetical protein